MLIMPSLHTLGSAYVSGTVHKFRLTSRFDISLYAIWITDRIRS